MSTPHTRSGSDLFVVDNGDQDWKVRDYLFEWCGLSSAIDIATGFFEIGGLLTLDDEWQKVDHIRILMGDEVSLRTKKAFADGLRQASTRLDQSIEAEKETNDFLAGVPAIVEGIRSGRIECRVYRKGKFHAKAYITHGRQAVIGSFGLVGSSNFTYPGLTENIELNVQLAGAQVGTLQDWYEAHWEQAEDVSADILRTIERHTHDYSPFEVYAKALHEFFRGHALTGTEWEESESRMFPVLDKYQRDGYHALLQIARQHGGAFLCDGVGLGKTFVGLMLIERLVEHDRKRVVLFAPKTARTDVWEPHLRRYLPTLGGVDGGDFSSLAVFSHTDLGRKGYGARFRRIQEYADVVVIDEAHHFRNPGMKGEQGGTPSRYRELFELLQGPNGVKQVFMLTATPVNNKLDDLRHMIELFSREDDRYFGRTVGVQSLVGHFKRMERALRELVAAGANGDEPVETDMAEAESILLNDDLFQKLVVQRSRAFVRKSQLQHEGTAAAFPEREAPRVAAYSIRKTYGRLLDMVDTAFHKQEPLFRLSIYYPLGFYIGSEPIDPLAENRQKQVVSLIRTQFLKRFESSAEAFERSCENMLVKLQTWAQKHAQSDGEINDLERWKRRHHTLQDHVHQHQLELGLDETTAEDDVVSDEMLEQVEELRRDEYDVPTILRHTLEDLEELARFLEELHHFQPEHDDKLQALRTLLSTDPVLREHKVIIFTEFADTAHYLRDQLRKADISGLAQIDSSTKADRSAIIRRFSPYYNDSSSAALATAGENEIRVLISTDVLSEGLNLQDATRLINYDLHWNPVRLMQRIGRVDRRMNPETEAALLADHPDQTELRGRIVYWNFLPPDDLEELLRLYGRVAHKTLRISKTFGIEGRKLLRPDDEYDPLKDFNHAYDGTPSRMEELRLEYDDLLKDDPGLADRLDLLPGRVFTGKQHPAPDTQAVFLCYRLPKPDHSQPGTEADLPWTEEAGETRWYLYALADGSIREEPGDIADAIRSTPETERRCVIEQKTLGDVRREVEKHIKDTHLKRQQAPIGVKPILKAWMELN